MLLINLWRRRKRHSRRSPQYTPHRRLELELLEDRSLLSTLNVNIAPTLDGPPESARQNETTIAINPTNPLNMIGGANEYQYRVTSGGQVFEVGLPLAHVTFDGGQSWTEYSVPFHGYNLQADPALSFDADGTAYLSQIAFARSPTNNGNAPDIVVNHSADGGKTWSDPVRVAKGRGNVVPSGQGVFPDKEYIVAWGHGNAIVT